MGEGRQTGGASSNLETVGGLLQAARAAFTTGKTVEAVSLTRRAHKLEPENIDALIGLAGLLNATGRPTEAIPYMRSALRIRPEPGGFYGLATAEYRAGLLTEAIASLERAISGGFHSVGAYDTLASALDEVGRFNDSAAWLARGLEEYPSSGSLYYRLVRSTDPAHADLRLASKMEETAQDQSLAAEDARYLHYALGKVYDDVGEYERAMRHFDQANQISTQIPRLVKRFSPTEYERAFKEARSQREQLRRLTSVRSDSDKPIFIVGMPRSGTTLLEQMLSRHPEIGAAGEVLFWTELPTRYPGVFSGPREHRDSTTKITLDAYLTTLDHLAPSHRYVTDKMPNNYMVLGFINAVLPKARIIHMSRSAVETCLSLYMTPLGDPPRYAHSKENITFAYKQYQALMDHWRSTPIAPSILDVQYEELIEDPESTLRSILNFCGLPWSPRCLEPQLNERTVRTPSLWQVRQPVYRTSLLRSVNYLPWLGAFRQLC